MRFAILLMCAAVLAGCAGSAVDRDFRSKVDSVSVHGGGTYDPATGAVGGSVDTTLHFRDPRTEGLAK